MVDFTRFFKGCSLCETIQISYNRTLITLHSSVWKKSFLWWFRVTMNDKNNSRSPMHHSKDANEWPQSVLTWTQLTDITLQGLRVECGRNTGNNFVSFLSESLRNSQIISLTKHRQNQSLCVASIKYFKPKICLIYVLIFRRPLHYYYYQVACLTDIFCGFLVTNNLQNLIMIDDNRWTTSFYAWHERCSYTTCT